MWGDGEDLWANDEPRAVSTATTRMWARRHLAKVPDARRVGGPRPLAWSGAARTRQLASHRHPHRVRRVRHHG